MLYEREIMAAPLNGFIYAWGEKSQIQNLCADKLKSEIMITPFTREALINKSVFKELLLKTLTALIGRSNSLLYSKDKIRDVKQQISKRIGERTINAYKGIRLALFFDRKFTYITMTGTANYLHRGIPNNLS